MVDVSAATSRTTPAHARRFHDAAAISCFFLSGFASLVFEIGWIRRATLVFGTTTYAVSSILAVFFLGLALGSYWFGRLGQRIERPIRLYALLEAGVGILAVLSFFELELADRWYSALYSSLADNTTLLSLARLAIVAVILLPPTVLMGGTLPLFCRQYVVHDAHLIRSVGFLYGMNTLGGALGCAAGGMLLLPQLGLFRTVSFGAGLNLLCGAVAYCLPLERTSGAGQKTPRRPAAERHVASPRVLAGLFFLVGFTALGLEVLWTRYLSLLVRISVYTYTITLTVVLAGIVLGSLMASRLAGRRAHVAFWFGMLQVLSALSVLLVMALPPSVLRPIDSTWVYILVLLPPAVFSGACFPLAIRMAMSGPSEACSSVGRMAAINTVGGVAGALAVGFIGLPFLGLSTCRLLLTAMNLLAGLVAWFWFVRETSWPRRVVALTASLSLWGALVWLPGTKIPADFLAADGRLLDYREGVGAYLAAIRRGEEVILEIERLWQGTNQKNLQTVAAHIPMLLHPDPKDVAVVGVGSGQTSSRILMHNVRSLDCIDIEPTIFEFIRKHFDSAWMDDPRVSLIRDDGRNYLIHTDRTYDVVSLEVGQTFRPGVALFYTADFYRQTRQCLRRGGLMVQFVPLTFLTPDQFRGVVRSFLEAFPASTLWYNRSELLLIGVNDDQFLISPQNLDRLTENPVIHQDLQYSPWGGPRYWMNQPEVFLASFLCGPKGLGELASGGRVYRDDLPVLDFATSRVTEKQMNNVPNAQLIAASIEPAAQLFIDSEIPWDMAEVDDTRAKNLSDIKVSALSRIVVQAPDLAAATKLRLAAAKENPDDVVTSSLLGQMLLKQKRFREAEYYFTQSLRSQPDDFGTRFGLAQCLLMLHRLQEAIVQFKVAVRLKPDSADAHNNLGVALLNAGQLRAAATHFAEAIRIEPDFAAARRNLARARSGRETRRSPKE